MKNEKDFIISLKKQIEKIIEKIIESEKKITVECLYHSHSYLDYHELIGEKIAYTNVLEILDDFLEEKG